MIELQDTARHDAVTELLPWYVNGTLDESERDLVREHIGVCDDCRENVELLSHVQRTVRNESPAPLVPAPRTDELLAALDGRDHSHALRSRWQWLAAASVVILVGVSSVLLWPRGDGLDSPTRFETATSPASSDSINYVVELRFVDGVSAEARTAIFDAIDAPEPATPAGKSIYRVTLALGPLSLTELEGYIEGIESHPEISTAAVVAVQLPVE